MRSTLHLPIVPILALAALAFQSRPIPGQAQTYPFGTPEIRAILDAVTKLNGYEYRDSNAPTPILNLQFRSPGPKDADLERLRPLLQKSTMPVSLNLDDSGSITDAGLAYPKDIATLRELSLGGTNVTIDGLKLNLTAFEKGLTKKIKPGEKIAVVGDYSLNYGGETVILLFYLPVKSK